MCADTVVSLYLCMKNFSRNTATSPRALSVMTSGMAMMPISCNMHRLYALEREGGVNLSCLFERRLPCGAFDGADETRGVEIR